MYPFDLHDSCLPAPQVLTTEIAITNFTRGVSACYPKATQKAEPWLCLPLTYMLAPGWVLPGGDLAFF